MKSDWCWPPKSYQPAAAIERYFAEDGNLQIRGREGILGQCEDSLCERFDQSRAILLCSGTSALYAAFFAIDIRLGDEIICPTVTFHATATPALHWGAKVILVDVDPETACIDPMACEAAITPRTKAIITNAQWGHPVDQTKIRDICNRHGLRWIEDISHAHGAAWCGQQVGTWGDLACMSLGAEKILTGGIAGVLMGRNNLLIDRAVLLTHYLFRSKSDIRTSGYEVIGRTGYGLKLGAHPLAAVIIKDQLKHHFDKWVEQRTDSLMRLREGLTGMDGLRVPTVLPEVTSMGGWYGFKPWVDLARIHMSREALVLKLKAHGVDVDIPGSPPLHTLPLFNSSEFKIAGWEKAEVDIGTFPNADAYSAGTLSIPTWTGPDNEVQLQQTIRGFRKVWDEIFP